MSSVLDQLNLSAQERRVLVGAAVVVFVVLNLWLVWPHFSDLGKVKRQLNTARQTMIAWNKEIALDADPSTGYKVQLAKLERQQGGGILNQQVQLQNTVRIQAIKNGVNVMSYQPVTSMRANTNEFFEEESIVISFDSQEPQLVNFLYDIGNDPSMIRVRQLHLRPADNNRYRLRGEITLTANFAKQPAAAAKKTVAAPVHAPAGPHGRPALSHPKFPNQKPVLGTPPGRKRL